MKEKERPTELSYRIIEYRCTHNLTQQQLAMELGVTPNTVHTWEKGIRSPSTGPMAMLAEMLGISFLEAKLLSEEVKKYHILVD